MRVSLDWIADYATLPAGLAPRQIAHDLTMATVEAKFGAPQTRHPAVGKPAITRWDYANFSVFFEGERVIDAVATSG